MSVTYLTAPEDSKVLEKFYQLVRPAGPGWKAITGTSAVESLRPALLNVILAILVVIGALFGTGHLIFGNYSSLLIYVPMAVIAAAFLQRRIKDQQI